MNTAEKTILAVLFFLVGVCASAHEEDASLIKMTEISAGVFRVALRPYEGTPNALDNIQVSVPERCSISRLTVQCPKQIRGRLSFKYLPEQSDTIFFIRFIDGRELTKLLSVENNYIDLDTVENSRFTVFNDYLIIGAEHIFFGFDHLLFVLGIYLLIGFNRRLLVTITCFTLAHSLTLVMSVLDYINIRQSGVEIVIALSLVLLATEASSTRSSAAKRIPWLLAIFFGLIHGLGFAGALQEVGLPKSALPLSLFAFNVGVELGQLVIILVAHLFVIFGSTLCKTRAMRLPAITRISCVYLIGVLGTYWAIARTYQMF